MGNSTRIPIKVETDRLEAVIPWRDPKQSMAGIENQSFLDRATGFREAGDGLMVIETRRGPASGPATSS